MADFETSMGELSEAHTQYMLELKDGVSETTQARIDTAIEKVNKAANDESWFNAKNFFEPPKIELSADNVLKMMKGGKEIKFGELSLGTRLDKLNSDVSTSAEKVKSIDSFQRGTKALCDTFGKEFAEKIGVPELKDGFSKAFYDGALSNLNIKYLKTEIKNPIFGKDFDFNSLKSDEGIKKAVEIFNKRLKEKGIDISKSEKFLNDPDAVLKALDDQIYNSKIPAEKTYWQQVKDIIADTIKNHYGKILLLGVGIFFGYELLEKIAKLNSGCMVTITPNDGKTGQCKIFSLTCDPELRSGSHQCSTKDYPHYITPLPDLPDRIKVGSTPSSPVDVNTVCNNTIKIDDKDKCSALCSPKYLMGSDANNKYEYTCADMSIWGALNKIGDDMLNIVGGAVNDIPDIFDSIKKWIAIFIFVVIGLFILSKLIPFFIKSKDPSHAFRSVRFNV